MYTLLTQGPHGAPVIRRAAVVSNEDQMSMAGKMHAAENNDYRWSLF